MLRDILEANVGHLTDSEFHQVLDLVTTDIKINRVNFGKRTSLGNAVEIARISFKALSRGKVA